MMPRTKKVQGEMSTHFNDTKKKQLATLVENHHCLWDLTSPLHRNSFAQSSAWESIAKSLNETSADCKRAWKSMRQSLRYRKTKKPKGKSGDALDEQVSGEDDDSPEPSDWTLWDTMKFLVDSSEQRTTLSSMEDSESLSGTQELHSQLSPDVVDQPEASEDSRSQFQLVSPEVSQPVKSVDRSAYAFVTRKRKLDSTDKLADTLSEFIKTKKGATTQLLEPTHSQLTFYSMFANLDRMWKKLPENVEQLNMDVTLATHRAMQEHETTTTFIFDTQ